MFYRKITAKNLTMPFAAFTMAGLVFIYSRTAIRAAKSNAAIHREADGGQISWQNQSLRQHGLLEGPDGSTGDDDHNPGLVGRALDRVAGGVPREQQRQGGAAGGVGSDNSTTSYTEQRVRERVKEGK